MTDWIVSENGLDKLKVFPLTIFTEDDDLELKLYANGHIEAVVGKIEDLEISMETMENYYHGGGGIEHVVLWLVAQIIKLREER